MVIFKINPHFAYVSCGTPAGKKMTTCKCCGGPAGFCCKSTERAAILPFEAVVKATSKKTARLIKRAASGSCDLATDLAGGAANLRCGECVSNKDGTYTFSQVVLVVVQRELAPVTKEFIASTANPELWDLCYTERQCAATALYCDVMASLLYVYRDGVDIQACDIQIARAAMCFFASLVKDPSADEVYKSRYIELHGGSQSDKVCAVCGKLGDFRECARCKSGVYICSRACHKSRHLAVCDVLVDSPGDANVQALRLAQEITTSIADADYLEYYGKPILSHICAVCGAAAKNKCPTCKKAYYCSRTCQALAFIVHKRLFH